MTQQLKVVSLDSIDVSKITIGDARKNKAGMGYSANLSYDGGYFNIALTNTHFPFGASALKEEFKKDRKDGQDKDEWSLQCDLTQERIDKLKSIDERIIDQTLANDSICSVLGLSDALRSRVVLQSKFTSTLKYTKDKETKKINYQYAPKIRVQIPNDKADGFTCEFFKPLPQGGSEAVPLDNIQGSEQNISTFLQSNIDGSVLLGPSVWLTGMGIGVTLRAKQVKADPRKISLSRGVCVFDDLTSDIAPNTISDPVDLNDDAESEVKSDNDLEDEDDEIVEEESEPEPEPPKKEVSKKSITKKAKVSDSESDQEPSKKAKSVKSKKA